MLIPIMLMVVVGAHKVIIIMVMIILFGENAQGKK